MKNYFFTIFRHQIIFILVVLMATGCAPKAPKIAEKEKQTMKNLATEMTTRCVGRYLIDLPETMKLNDQHGAKIDEAQVHIKFENQSDFTHAVKKRENELQSMKLDGRGDNILKEVIPIPNGFGFIFDRARTQSSNVLRALELHGWKDNYYIKMEIDSRDMSFSDGKLPAGDTRRTTTPEKLQELLNLFSRTSGRKDSDIPTTQGTCIPNGFISGPPGVREDIGVAYELMEDVWLGFDSDSGISETTTLLDRAKDIEWGLSENEGKTIRKGSRKSADDFKFEEWLSALRTNDHVMGHLFLLEANSKIGSVKFPLINIELHNGLRAPRPPLPYDSPEPPVIEKASLGEAEAIALWDAITNTLRSRPGAF